MDIRYEQGNCAWSDFPRDLAALVGQPDVTDVCELGGGANPAISVQDVLALGLNYTVADIAEGELAKAPDGYKKVLLDVASRKVPIENAFDLIFSKMLAEHVESGAQFHRNVLQMLRPGGMALHFFPTLYAPPFVLNRLIPESWSSRVLSTLQKHRAKTGRQGKFPAYYSWCRGPTTKQIRRFTSLGYEIVRYHGYFGHDGYYRRLPVAGRLHRGIARFLVRHPRAELTSFAVVLLRKPSVGALPHGSQ